jgi:hypothetical protein
METCPGQHYRCDIEQFKSDRGFSARVRFRKLIKESCPGCEACAEVIRRISLLGKGGAYVDNLAVARHGEKFKIKLKEV